jgi:hypothetical protein
MMEPEAVAMPETPAGNAEHPGWQSRPFSLRWRMSLIASGILVLALGLVGYALAAANQRGAVSTLQSRMESYVYLVLAAAEVDRAGRLQLGQDLGDPRLSQPGSLRPVHGLDQHWNSPSPWSAAARTRNVKAGNNGLPNQR